MKKRFYHIVGDATQDNILEKASIRSAAHLIAALPDDTENLYIVLTARQLAPKLNIISRYSNPRSEDKLRLAGANKVLMPEQIGGFYMATLINKPGAIDFLSYIAQENNKDIGLEKILFEDLPAALQEKKLGEMNLNIACGAHVLSYHHPDGHIDVNPSVETKMEKGGSFIALGSEEQLEKLKKFLKKG